MGNNTIRSAVRRKFPAVGIDDTLETAMKTMAQEKVSALVVKVGDELVGIVTTSDILYSLSNNDDPQETRISSFMTKCEIASENDIRNPCVQLDEDEEIMSAVKVMYDAGVSHLLVSGREGEPVGMVSSIDIVTLLAS